ncbi:MAG: LPS-assembly protein LptD [Campylobacterales bacterium]|nr:LPS-assembly protein LptD [Campylobacterales bacterium]
MFRLFFLFVLVVSGSFAKDKIEIYASFVDSKESVVKAYDGVTVVYKEYFLTSKEAVYDRDSGVLELFGNVRANYENRYKILGNYAKLNIVDKEKAFKPFYMIDKTSQLWISSSNASAKDDDMRIDGGSMSGCNPNDPLWTIDFESSTYNTESKWLNIYNARLYIYDIPVFYTPYFGYSLDKTRRSGLLMPTMGYSSDEGLFYEQPIYIAEDNWWDLELNPQVRTNRGSGLYTKFRFKDSKVSNGEFRVGYFKEKEAYADENNLANDSHYGFDFKYQNSDYIDDWFGVNVDAQTELYVDVTNMNDVDYINLSKSDSSEYETASQLLSNINIFYNDNENYYGAYFKYYKNLELESNENTLQKLPTFHYHHYLDSFFNEHLFYNIDIQSTNIYREINKKALQTDVNLPVTIQSSFFDEYLNLSYNANFYIQNSQFFGTEETASGLSYDNGTFLRQHNTLSASTHLTKALEDYTHSVVFSVDFIFDGFENKNGFYDFEETQNEFYNINDITNVLKFNFYQYLFDKQGSQKLYHKLSQYYYYEKNGDEKFGDIENELEYHITDAISIYNNTFYNYEQSDISKLYNEISFDSDVFDISLSHLYRDFFDDKLTNTNYLTSSVRYRYNERYSYMARYDYDLELNLRKNAEIGFLYQKRCWEFGVRYAQTNRPILEAGQTSSIDDRYIYFTIVFKPFMESGSKPMFIHHLSQE